MITGKLLRKFFARAARRAPHNSPPKRTLADDIQAAAGWISTALLTSGYRADFSPESIKEIERFFGEHSADGNPMPGGLLSEDLGQRLFALGAYCGETLRRELGGEWLTDDDDPEGEIHVAVQFTDGSIVWPVERVAKRLAGEENNLFHWAVAIRRMA